MVKEIMMCKFDNDVECSSYLCEEDSSTIEFMEANGKTCSINDRMQELELEVYALKKQLNSKNESRSK